MRWMGRWRRCPSLNPQVGQFRQSQMRNEERYCGASLVIREVPEYTIVAQILASHQSGVSCVVRRQVTSGAESHEAYVLCCTL